MELTDELSYEELALAAHKVAAHFGVATADAVEMVRQTWGAFAHNLVEPDDADVLPPDDFRCPGCERFQTLALHDCVGFDHATEWPCQCECAS